jgi:hypothetical protein
MRSTNMVKVGKYFKRETDLLKEGNTKINKNKNSLESLPPLNPDY